MIDPVGEAVTVGVMLRLPVMDVVGLMLGVRLLVTVGLMLALLVVLGLPVREMDAEGVTLDDRVGLGEGTNTHVGNDPLQLPSSWLHVRVTGPVEGEL